MGDSPAVRSSGLIERLDSKAETISENDPFYWYKHLESLGKHGQTKEMVEEAVKNFNVDTHGYSILKVVAKKYITCDVCEIAVSKNGLNLRYAPEQYRDTIMCLTAVQSDGDALAYVPRRVLLGDEGYEICLAAVRNSFYGRALASVPKCYLDGEEGKALCEAAVQTNEHALEHVPRRLITKELVSLSARLHPKSLKYAPAKFVSRDLCFEMIERDPMNLQYVPKPDKELVDCALKTNPRAILVAPTSLLTMGRCRSALQRDPTIPMRGFPENIRMKLEKEFQSDAFIKYEPISLETPAFPDDDRQAIALSDEPHTCNLAYADNSAEVVCYISDIHLEHQLANDPHDIMKLSLPEIQRRIDEKIDELLSSGPKDIQATLLIGGDVANSIELEKLFYDRLASFFGNFGRWNGNIIAILGNHELWDGDPMGLKPARPIDEIIADYRQAMPSTVTLLENDLFIVYKGQRREVLDEQTILDASVEELAEVCSNSTFLLLGGIGFSGLNPAYNAETGLYRATVSTEEDIARSKRFRAVYEKVLTGARDIPVIVLTHMQMADWSDAQYNPKWIYVNGHTHRNTFFLQPNGASVFSDNQIGYKPKRWHLNAFTIDTRRYDPFRNYPNGIHQITREDYIEFNHGQGITMRDMKHPGNLHVLKYDGVYMFVLESTNGLCLLEGGRRHKLDHDINYYYKNLPEYMGKIRRAFSPYQKALSVISDEVKAFGGSGTVHGCIVDIDWFNHVYLNPFDGKVTPYFALDTINKVAFGNVESLLKSSPYPPLLRGGKSMLERFTFMAKENRLPVLSHNTNTKCELAAVPQVVLETSMYEPSHIMRSIQYAFDQNVLRIWKDEILAIDDDRYQVLPGTNKLLSS